MTSKLPTTTITTLDLAPIIKEAVGQHIKDLLTDQLDNIVMGELAKMRLLQPGKNTLQERIENKVERMIAAELNKEQLKNLIRVRTDQRARATADEIMTTLKKDALRELRTSLKRKVTFDES